jgi:hypothetical protein
MSIKKISQSVKASYHLRKVVNPYDYSKGLPRIRWIMLDTITNQQFEVVNLRKFCKEHGVNSQKVNQGLSRWKILEKYSIKTGKRIL